MQAHPFNSAHAQGTELQRIDFSSLPGIHPVFITADGDTVYALSAALLEEAIVDAVQAARLSEDEFRKQVNY